MSKIILTTEDELEALLKRVLNELLQTLPPNGNSGEIKSAGEIMTIKQVSELLHLSVQTLYGKTSARTIPHFKKGKKLYFKREEVFEWITQDKRKTKDELMREWEENQMLRRKKKS
jgi:excisionase family DNA binding protein